MDGKLKAAEEAAWSSVDWSGMLPGTEGRCAHVFGFEAGMEFASRNPGTAADCCDKLLDADISVVWLNGEKFVKPGPATARLVAKAKLYLAGEFHGPPDRVLLAAFVAEHEGPAQSESP